MGMRCSQREYRADATLLPRELQREKVWSRIHLVPLLLAEGDRDAYRRQQAALEREREIMKDVPGWEVSDISNGEMTRWSCLLITWFPGVVPCYAFLRRICDRLVKASTTTRAIGLRSRSWLYDGSWFLLYHLSAIVQQSESEVDELQLVHCGRLIWPGLRVEGGTHGSAVVVWGGPRRELETIPPRAHWRPWAGPAERSLAHSASRRPQWRTWATGVRGPSCRIGHITMVPPYAIFGMI